MAEVALDEATGSMSLAIASSMRTPAKSVEAIRARMRTAVQMLQDVSVITHFGVMSTIVCDILVVHSFWCWFFSAGKNDLRPLHQQEKQEQPEQQRQQQRQRQHCIAQWRQPGRTMFKSGMTVCAVVATAVLVTCKAKSGQRSAARAVAIRRKTIRQRSKEASGRALVPLARLPSERGPFEAMTSRTESAHSASSLEEQWWFEESASGKDEALGSRVRTTSGNCRDAIQPEQQLQQWTQEQKQEQLHNTAASPQCTPSTPRIRNLLSPQDVESSPGTPPACLSLQGRLRMGSSVPSTPRSPLVRNLLSSEELASSTPNGTSSSRLLFHRQPSTTNLVPTG